jgi:hypothetical protein
MKKILLLVGAITVLSLLEPTATIFAANCRDFIQSNTYSCELKSGSQDVIQGTFQFASPGAFNSFDLLFDELLILGCECVGKGNFKNPKFGESTEFVCVSRGETGIPAGFSVLGKAARKGITGQLFIAPTVGLGDDTAAFFQCTLDTLNTTAGG